MSDKKCYGKIPKLRVMYLQLGVGMLKMNDYTKKETSAECFLTFKRVYVSFIQSNMAFCKL